MDNVNSNQPKITALEIPDLIKLLKRSGSRSVSDEAVKNDIANGAPTNPDGTVNLIFNTAWLIREASDNGN